MSLLGITQCSDGLDFEDDAVCDDQIGAVFADNLSAKFDNEWNLPRNLEAGFTQCDTQGIFVNRFEEAVASSL